MPHSFNTKMFCKRMIGEIFLSSLLIYFFITSLRALDAILLAVPVIVPVLVLGNCKLFGLLY